jgi:uncharacterized protein with HEPN domain
MREDDAYLLDMLNGARRLANNYATMSREAYDANAEAQAASFWIICIIGEAAGRVSDTTREIHQEIPWSQVKGTRNVLIHGYDSINLDRVWDIITVFAPEMIRMLEPFVQGKENYE